MTGAGADHSEQRMSTGAEYARHRPHAQEARVDEEFVRILFVEDRTDFAEAMHQSLGRAARGSFDLVRESDLVRAAEQIQGERFDLLLVDLSLASIGRRAAIELANDLAHRLPVVVLTGTEDCRASDCGRPDGRGLSDCIDHAEVAGKLLSAIRRSRRLGTGVMAPVFCRIEGLCAEAALR
jgi:CheY-like chemotaxis protein